MCRNIKTLFNFDPPATDEEIRAASLQFVRKLSGFNAPSKANEAAFDRAIDDVAAIARRLIDSLRTGAAPRNREEVAAPGRMQRAVATLREERGGDRVPGAGADLLSARPDIARLLAPKGTDACLERVGDRDVRLALQISLPEAAPGPFPLGRRVDAGL